MFYSLKNTSRNDDGNGKKYKHKELQSQIFIQIPKPYTFTPILNGPKTLHKVVWMYFYVIYTYPSVSVIEIHSMVGKCLNDLHLHTIYMLYIQLLTLKCTTLFSTDVKWVLKSNLKVFARKSMVICHYKNHW